MVVEGRKGITRGSDGRCRGLGAQVGASGARRSIEVSLTLQREGRHRELRLPRRVDALARLRLGKIPCGALRHGRRGTHFRHLRIFFDLGGVKVGEIGG
jgi:hypothetical protein